MNMIEDIHSETIETLMINDISLQILTITIWHGVAINAYKNVPVSSSGPYNMTISTYKKSLYLRMYIT